MECANNRKILSTGTKWAFKKPLDYHRSANTWNEQCNSEGSSGEGKKKIINSVEQSEITPDSNVKLSLSVNKHHEITLCSFLEVLPVED